MGVCGREDEGIKPSKNRTVGKAEPFKELQGFQVGAEDWKVTQAEDDDEGEDSNPASVSLWDALQSWIWGEGRI